MPSSDDDLMANVQEWGGGGGGGGGGYFYDPTLIPGYYNVMGDPLAGDSTDPGGYYPGDNGVGPGMGNPSDPGFADPTTGEWVPNPGYDPTSDPSTVNNLPYVNSTPNVNPDPNAGEYDPTGGSGTVGDPYDLGQNTPTFTATGVTTNQQDPGSPQIHTPPEVSNPPIDPMPSDVGDGIQRPYPPAGQMTTGNNPRQGPSPQQPQQPTSQPPTTQPPTTTPTRGGTQTPPTKTAAAPRPMPGANFSLSMGMPGISAGLPADQKFSYQPISIARQGVPNPQVIGQGQQSSPQQQFQPPSQYDYTGQTDAALKKLGTAAAGYLGVPTSLSQLRQNWGLTKQNWGI